MVWASGICCLGLALSLASAAADAGCAAAGGPRCSSRAAAPFCPCKGCNLNRSGLSQFTGPVDISKPTWIWEEPNRRSKTLGSVMKVFHGSPMLDGDYNTYIQSTTGYVYSIDVSGKTRWEFDTKAESPGNVVLQDGVVYAISQDAVAYAIDAMTGKELWRNRFALGAPGDTHSPIAHGDLLLTACNQKVHGSPQRDPHMMNEAICALNTSNGQLQWIFDQVVHSGRIDAITCNSMPAIVGRTAIFSDNFGGVYRAALEDGEIQWFSGQITDYSKTGQFPYATTATSVVGPNDRIYHAFNPWGGVGVVRAHNIHDGTVVWAKYFPNEVNAAPAVGHLYGWRTQLAVVAALGDNPNGFPATFKERLQYWISGREHKSSVVAFHAEHGHILWTFVAPAFDGRVAGSYFSEDGEGALCFPDLWGNPAIGGDGTVYMNWSGGKAFALRDANGDGIVDPKDPKEVSSYHHAFGSNGQTAIAPGYVVAPSCRSVMAFSS